MKTTRLAALGVMLSLQPALAQETAPSSQEIVNALLPTGLDGRKVKGARSIDGALDSSRGVKIVEGKKVPFINLRVTFEYDSDQLSNDSMLTMRRLGEALSDEAFKDSKFRIVGHTDARGTEEYNRGLSRRRARSVTDYLASRYQMPSERIEVAARGEGEPLPGMDPEDGRNRRVEVQNISAAAQ